MGYILNRQDKEQPQYPAYLSLVGPTIQDRSGTVTPTITGPTRYAQGKLAGYRNPTMFDLNPSNFTFDDRAATQQALTVSGPQRLALGRNSRINYCTNSSFETNATGWGTTNGTGTRIPGGVSGSWAYQVVSSGATPFTVWYVYTPHFVAGQTVTVSWYARTIAGATPTLQLAWYHKKADTTASGSQTVQPLRTLNRAWTRYSETFTLTDANSHGLILYFYGSGSDAIYELDAAQIELSSTASEYFDGTFTNCAFYNYYTGVTTAAWAGHSISNPAIYSEESTTNILKNPSLEGSIGAETTQRGLGATQTQDSTYAYLGTKSHKVVGNGTSVIGGNYASATSLGLTGAANPYIGQVMLRSPSSEQVNVFTSVRYTDATFVDSAVVTVTLNNTWQRVVTNVLTLNAAKTVDYIFVYWQSASGTSNGTVYADCAQLEQKAYATSYADGSLGTGYSWSGTANASSSTRAAVSYALSKGGVYNPYRGAFAGWFKRDYVSVGDQYITVMGSFGGSEFVLINANGSNAKLTTYNGTSTSTVTTPLVGNTSWNFVYAEWDASTLKISVNGGALVSAARSAAKQTNSDVNMAFASGAGYLAGALESVSIFDQPLTSTDIANLYAKTDTWSLTSLKSFTSEVYESTARINYVTNPRAANATSGWFGTGGLTRITNDGVSGTTSVELPISSGLTAGLDATGVSGPGTYTYSFYVKWVSGPTTFTARFAEYGPNGSPYLAVQSGANTFTATSAWQRFSISWTTQAVGLHALRLQFSRSDATLGTYRFTDVQLEDGLGATSYFDGSFSNAVWANYRTYVQGTAHASPSVSHAAPFIEEGTTNLLRNPAAGVNLTDFNADGSSTVTRDTAYANIGSASVKVVTPGVILNEGLQIPLNTGWVNGGAHQGSVYLRGSGTVNVFLYIVYTDASNEGITPITVTLTDQWQRVICPNKVANGAKTIQGVNIYVRNTTITTNTYWVANAQIENKTYATSYCDGTLGTGYSWSGTAHASNSTRTAATEYISPTNHLNLSAGSVSLWAQFSSFTSANQSAFAHVTGTPDTRVYLFRGPSQQLTFGLGASSNLITDSVVVANDTWVHIVGTWDGTNGRLYKNGTLVSSATAYSSMVALATRMDIGSNQGSSQWLNGSVDGLQTFDRAISTSEITALYNSRTPRSMKSLNSYKPRLSRSKLDLVLQRQPKVSTTPVLFHYGGNGLSGRDRVGSVAGTASGAMRYQPFQGARINLVSNPRFALNSTGWVGQGGGNTVTRVLDSKFVGGTALETVTTGALSYEGALVAGTTPNNLPYPLPSVMTISFDAQSISGPTSNFVVGLNYFNGFTYVGGNAFSASVTLSKSVKRITLTSAVSFPISTHRAGFYITQAAASVFRISNVVVEVGTVANATYFDGSTQGMWLDPITGIVGTSHASPSVSHAVPWIEEGTTNLLANPSAENASIFVGIAAVAGATITKDTTYALFGASSLKTVTSNLGTGEGSWYFTDLSMGTTSARTFAGSIYVRGSGTITINLRCAYSDTSVDVGNTVGPITLTDSWQRITGATLTTNAAKTLNGVYIRISTSVQQAATIYSDGAQIEEKAYSTSFCDGSLGTGYSWSGTANASSSVRAYSYLNFPDTNHINIDKGSIATWVYFPSNAFNPQRWIEGGQDGVAGQNAFYLDAVNNIPIFTWRVGTAAATNVSWVSSIAVGWHYLYAEWDGTNIGISVDGQAKKYGTRTAPTGILSNVNGINVGYLIAGNQQINGYIGPIIINDRTLSQSEISAYYSNPSTYSWNKASANNVNLTRTASPLTLTRSNKTTTTPSLLHLVGNSLTGTDRNGSVAVTSSGAFRVQPANGARINLVKNPRFANDTSGWVAYGAATCTRVLDTTFVNGTAVESSTAVADNGVSLSGTSASIASILSKTSHVLSFDAKLVSGATNWQVQFTELNAAGTGLGGAQSTFTVTTMPTRFAFAYTPTQTGVQSVIARIVRSTSVSGVIRISNVVLEQGSTVSPVPKYFDGSFAGAAWADPITGILGTSHASPSFSQAAYWVEEGTTNYCTNPRFEVDLTNWATLQATATRVTTYARVGSASGQFTRNTSSGYFGCYPGGGSNRPAASVGQAWTVTGWVRGTSGVPLTPSITWYDAANGGGSVISAATGSVTTLNDTWQQFTVSGTAPASTASFVFTLYHQASGTIGDTFYLTNVQFEQKAYATAYCDGSLGSGYSWTGTAHASTSTRTATSVTTIEDNHINATTGSALVWFKRDSDTGSFQRVLMVGAQLAGIDYLTLRVGTGDQLEQLMVTGTSANVYSAASVAQATVGVWHMAYIEWTSTAFGVSLNNATLVTNTKESPNGTFVSPTYDLGIGVNNLTNIQQINGAIGPLMIFDRPLTTAERSAFYSNPSQYGFNTLIPSCCTNLIRSVS